MFPCTWDYTYLEITIFLFRYLSMFTLDTFVLVKCTILLSEYLTGIEATAFTYFHFALLCTEGISRSP